MSSRRGKRCYAESSLTASLDNKGTWVPDIFISYRRSDSERAAQRLVRALRQYLPHMSIRADLDLEPGQDPDGIIDGLLNSCGALLIVIGPHWLEGLEDVVRRFISRALKEGAMQVIPILVEGAASPEADQLPDELKPLARRNPLVLHDENWDEGLDRLARALSTCLGAHLSCAGPGRPDEAQSPAHGDCLSRQAEGRG